MFVHVHTYVCYNLYSFGLVLPGVTGNEEMTDASHKHKAGMAWILCLDGERQQPGSVSLLRIAGQGGGLVNPGVGSLDVSILFSEAGSLSHLRVYQFS